MLTLASIGETRKMATIPIVMMNMIGITAYRDTLSEMFKMIGLNYWKR